MNSSLLVFPFLMKVCSRRWKNFQRLWKRLAGAVIREFAAEFEASLTQLVLHLEKFRNYSLTQAVMACANS